MDFISMFVGLVIGVSLCVGVFSLFPADGKLIVRKNGVGERQNQYIFQIDDVDKAIIRPRIVLAVSMFNEKIGIESKKPIL